MTRSPAPTVAPASAPCEGAALVSEAPRAAGTSFLLRAVRSIALQDVVQLAYLVFLLSAVYAGAGGTRVEALEWLAFDLAVFGAGMVAYRGARTPSRVAAVAYRIATCVPVIATFGQLHLILRAATTARLDAQLLALDLRLLRYEPAVAWDALVSTAATEWLSLFYLSYFLVLGAHVGPLLAFERRPRLLAEFTLGIVTVFCVGHALYVLVPAFGPWEYLAGTFHHPLRGGFWYPRMHRLVASGGARADVFPSLHTAGPAFITMFSWRHRRVWPYRATWPVVAFVTTQIIVATMYLRWHYALDVLAGLVLAAVVTRWSGATCAWEDVARRRRLLPPVWER